MLNREVFLIANGTGVRLGEFLVELNFDQPGILATLSNVFAEHDVNIINIAIDTTRQHLHFIADLTLQTEEQIQEILKQLQMFAFVKKVKHRISVASIFVPRLITHVINGKPALALEKDLVVHLQDPAKLAEEMAKRDVKTLKEVATTLDVVTLEEALYIIQLRGLATLETTLKEGRLEARLCSLVQPLGFEKENEDVAALHILAASADMPLRPEELTPFEKTLAERLLAEGRLRVLGRFLRITPEGRGLLSALSLRGSPHVVKIKTADSGVIGERELPLALYELHPEAIYMHGGRTYLSKSLDLSRRVAVVEPADAEDLVTHALEDMEPEVVEVYDEGAVEGVPYQFGRLKIKITVYGYALKRFITEETLGEYTIEPISYEFETKGAVFYMPHVRFSTNEAVDWEARAKGYHATEHVLISAAEIALGASKTDLGGISYPDGVIVIYDSHVGGNGTTRLLINNFRRVAEVALKIVKGCDCVDGCPKCVYSPYCGNNNKMLSRRNAVRILQTVLNKEGAPLLREIPRREKGIV